MPFLITDYVASGIIHVAVKSIKTQSLRRTALEKKIYAMLAYPMVYEEGLFRAPPRTRLAPQRESCRWWGRLRMGLRET